jgi:uncharacterized protein (TIGR02284 family)
MAHGSHRVGNTLENLIRVNRKAISGYEIAVQNVKEYSHKDTLQSMRAQHFEFMKELKDEFEHKDYDRDESNVSYLRQLHDGWADVTAQFTKGDPKYILSDVLRMLRTMRNLYNDAQEAPFDSETSAILTNHLSNIEDNIKTIKNQYQDV